MEQTMTAMEWARKNGITFEWSEDWEVGDHRKEYGEAYTDGEPTTCEQCDAVRDGEIVASIGCVDDADDDYRRFIEADLADDLKRRGA